jgi:hypothetical protein
MIKKYLLVILLMTVFAWYNSSKTVVAFKNGSNEAVNLILSRKDKRRLELFFYSLFSKGTAAYTLNGPKPMALHSLRPFKLTSHIFNDFSAENLMLVKGYTTWEKYQHLFLGSIFHLWLEPSNYSKRVDYLFLANKKSLIPLVKTYTTYFQKYSNVDSMEETTIIQNLSENTFFQNFLNKNDILLGIALGYNPENAEMYCKKALDPKLKIHPFWDKSFYQECNRKFFLNKKTFTSHLISYPFFMGNSSSMQGQLLKKRFLEAREKNLDLFESGNFLETVLTLLSKNY